MNKNSIERVILDFVRNYEIQCSNISANVSFDVAIKEIQHT